MRGLIRSFTLVLGVGLISSQAALTQEPITLENAELRVSLSPQNATLLSVQKKQTNASYLGSSKQAGWFRVQIPLPYWEGHAAATNDLKAVSVRQSGPEAVEFQATQLVSKEGTQSVSLKLAMRLAGDNLVCKLSLQNQTQQTIDRIIFPILGVPAATDAREALIIPKTVYPFRSTFSRNAIRTDHNPLDTLDPQNAWFLDDPLISARAFNYPCVLNSYCRSDFVARPLAARN